MFCFFAAQEIVNDMLRKAGWGGSLSMWREAEKQHSPALISKDSLSKVTSKGATPLKGSNHSFS